MKILLKTAVAFAGLTFGVSTGLAHPSFNATCTVLDPNKVGHELGLKNDVPACGGALPCTEELDFNATQLGQPGEMTITCRGDNLQPPPTATTILNFSNTGDQCHLGLTGVTTQNWQEVITTDGEVTLTCVFPPH